MYQGFALNAREEDFNNKVFFVKIKGKRIFLYTRIYVFNITNNPAGF